MKNCLNLDKINISLNDMYEILRWRDANRELLREVTPPISEAIIEIQDISHIYFKYVSKTVSKYKVYYNNKLSIEIHLRKIGDVYRVELCEVADDYALALQRSGTPIRGETMVADVCTLVLSILSFMQTNPTDVFYKNIPIKQGYKGEKVVRIHRKDYYIRNIRERANESMNKHSDIEGNKE